MKKCDKLQKYIYSVTNTVIRVLLLVITVGLCLQSMFSTSFIGSITGEGGSRIARTRNIADQPWKHLLVFVLITVIGILFYHGYCFLEKYFFVRRTQYLTASGINDDQVDDEKRRAGTVSAGRDRILWVLSGIVLMTGTAWILMTQLKPGSDPAKVYSIAMQWRRGDFSAYAEGGYLFRYPFQAGIILFYYFLSFLFGLDNYIGLQFINVLSLVAVYVLLVKLSVLFWKKERKLSVLVYIALILWVPLAFYITYLYGILPGMALSMGAVYATVRYTDTGKYQYILPACVCMGLATVIKMNCLIYLIAIACFLLYDALQTVLSDRKEKWKRCVVSLALIALMGVSVAGCNRAVEKYVEHLSGYEAGDGEALISWVVMGLQETPLGPGGYSGYIAEVFIQHEYDTEKIKEASIEDIKKIVKRMSENIVEEGIPFFARKNAFQWNDPTFIGMDRTRGRASTTEVPALAASLIEGRGSVVLSVLLNYMQTLLLLGMLLYLILNRHSDNLYELMGAVVFLGGYLFHFVWESSASYTIPYFVLLIPYAVKGLVDWVRSVLQLLARIRACRDRGIRIADIGEILKRNKIWFCVGIVTLTLFLMFTRTNLFHRTIALDDGEEARAQFYHEDGHTGYLENAKNRMYMSGIRDGYYYLSPCMEPEMILVEEAGEVMLVSVAAVRLDTSEKTGQEKSTVSVPAVENIEQKILLNMEKASDTRGAGISIRFRSNEQVLAVKTQEDGVQLTVYMDDSMNMFYDSDANVSYRWEFLQADTGGYYIMINDVALTYRDGVLSLEEADWSEEQRWILH